METAYSYLWYWLMDNKKIDLEISQVVGKIINGYGVDYLKANSGIKPLLMDLLPKYVNERELLIKALSLNVGVDLYASWERNGKVLTNAKQNAERILKEAFIAATAAKRVIRWLCNSFDVKEALPRHAYQGKLCSSPSIATKFSYEKVVDAEKNISKMQSIADRFLNTTTKNMHVSKDGNKLEARYEADGTVLKKINLYCTNFTIEAKVSRIAAHAFANAKFLESVTFTNNVEVIEREAFWGCTRLKNVVLLPGVKIMGEGLFRGCIELVSVILPASISEISACMFKNCVNLSNINIPASLERIASEAFSGCHNLREIRCPDSLFFIDTKAFWGCSNLKKVFIPSNVREIGAEAFSGCSNDLCVDILNNDYAFEYCRRNDIKCHLL